MPSISRIARSWPRPCCVTCSPPPPESPAVWMSSSSPATLRLSPWRASLVSGHRRPPQRKRNGGHRNGDRLVRRQRGYDTTVVIPGDIPLVTSAELHSVLDAAPGEGAVFVPAYDRRGSNCVLRRPANLIPLRFGNDSFLPHCEAMRQTGKPLVILRIAGHRARYRPASRTRPAAAARRRYPRAAPASLMGIRSPRDAAMEAAG